MVGLSKDQIEARLREMLLAKSKDLQNVITSLVSTGVSQEVIREILVKITDNLIDSTLRQPGLEDQLKLVQTIHQYSGSISKELRIKISGVDDADFIRYLLNILKNDMSLQNDDKLVVLLESRLSKIITDEITAGLSGQFVFALIASNTHTDPGE